MCPLSKFFNWTKCVDVLLYEKFKRWPKVYIFSTTLKSPTFCYALRSVSVFYPL